jgi:hypothetical protein
MFVRVHNLRVQVVERRVHGAAAESNLASHRPCMGCASVSMVAALTNRTKWSPCATKHGVKVTTNSFPLPLPAPLFSPAPKPVAGRLVDASSTCLQDEWDEVVLVGILSCFDRGVGLRCQSRRGGVAVLVDLVPGVGPGRPTDSELGAVAHVHATRSLSLKTNGTA